MPKSYRTCEIMQQLDYLTKDDIEKGLDHNAVKDYAYILHDKDLKSDGSVKPAHWHIMLRFKDSVPTESICKWFGIKENYISKIHGSFADALAYLTHLNAPNKTQYLEENVVSNFDFKKEAALVSARAADKHRKMEIVEQIKLGAIREFNYTDYISVEEYDKYKNSIDHAFSYRRDTLAGLDRKMTVVYIWGLSGCGKTTYAKELCESKGYSTYISSGSNDPLDSYKGQDAVILDDVRPWDFDISDFLKMLDNNTQSTVKSRYRNKMLECRLMILTTSMSMQVFFRNILGNETEKFAQFARRVQVMIEMEKNVMHRFVYQPESGYHMKIDSCVNPVAERFKKRDMTREEAQGFLDDLFSGKPASPDALGFRPDVPHDVELKFETWNQLDFKKKE